MFTNERRQEVERIIVLAVINAALDQGWTLEAVNNGEDEVVKPTIEQAMSEAFACADAHLFFEHPNGERGWFYIVLGNSGWDVLCDYTVNMDDVNAAVESLIDNFEQEAYS